MTKDYLHRRWKKLGGYRDADNRIKFSAATIESHIRTSRRP